VTRKDHVKKERKVETAKDVFMVSREADYLNEV
jgi:hypothetical protein